MSRGSEAEADTAKEKATAESIRCEDIETAGSDNHGEDTKNRSELNKYDDNCDQTVKIKI